MPELPEIETVKLQLTKYLVGKRIEKIEKLHIKSLHGDPKLVEEKKIKEIRRLGKMLVIDTEGSLCIAIHFKMSGQLVYLPHPNPLLHKEREMSGRIVGGHPTSDWIGKLPSKHTRAIFYFSDKSRMYFNDQRIFGWVKILKDTDLQNLKFVQKLGKEPWDMTAEAFFTLITKRKKAIKVLIMDQEVISGVGNIYANDGLWEAKIHPSTSAQSLAFSKAKLLRNGLIKVLKEGIRYGGATSADAKYINLDGLGGHYQDHFRTYDREGEKCLRKDGGMIQKITLGGRGTYFCPVCQK